MGDLAGSLFAEDLCKLRVPPGRHTTVTVLVLQKNPMFKRDTKEPSNRGVCNVKMLFFCE